MTLFGLVRIKKCHGASSADTVRLRDHVFCFSIKH